jgi:hypothetical protein
MLFKTPSGYVQQSPWLGIINKQLEMMARYMTEMGMTPAARSRMMPALCTVAPAPETIRIERIIVTPGENGGPPTREPYAAIEVDNKR